MQNQVNVYDNIIKLYILNVNIINMPVFPLLY